MKATGHQATSPVDEALSRTQPLNPAGSGIASAQSVQASSRARPSLLETIRYWLQPAPDLNQVFDQIDPGCLKMTHRKRKLLVGLCEIGEGVRARPQVSSVRLEHEVDPESGWEQIYLVAISDLSVDGAISLESEIVRSIPKEQWHKIFKDVFISVRPAHDNRN